MGFSCIFSSHVLLAWFSPDFFQELPHSFYLFAAWSVFVYQTLDNCDGKHAVRTQTSSPLGHMFDHGCDALAISLIGGLVCVAAQLGFTTRGLMVMSAAGYTQAYFATWEEYQTGQMTLGAFNGPIEGLLTTQILLFLTGIYGPAFWDTRCCDVVFHPGAQCPLGTLTLRDLLVYALYATSIFTCLSNVKTVRAYGKRHGQSFVSAVSRLVPLVVLLGSAFFCVVYSPTGLYAQHGFIFFWALGITVAYFVTRMLLAHLCKDEFPAFSPILLPWIAMAANVLIGIARQGRPLLSETLLLDMALIYGFATYLHLIYAAATDFHDRLGIPLLTIPKRAQ